MTDTETEVAQFHSIENLALTAFLVVFGLKMAWDGDLGWAVFFLLLAAFVYIVLGSLEAMKPEVDDD